MTHELPPTWATTTVGSVSFSMQYGYTASASDAPCGPRFLRITDIQDGSVEWSTVPYCEIDREAVPKYAVQDGDLLVARTGGTVGKSFLIREPPEAAVFASYLIRISPSGAVDPRYLAHYFRSAAYWQQIGMKKGGLLGNVNSTTLASVELPLAPKPEQQRIASKIDELFSRIDHGERALERVSMLVERYRQSVLKAAVTGELTRAWREKNKDKLESGEALLARILTARREAWEKAELEKMKAKGITAASGKWKERYEDAGEIVTDYLGELPLGWQRVRVDAVGEVQLGRQRSPAHHSGEFMKPYLRVANVYEERIETDDVMFMNFTPEEFVTYALRSGDVLLNEGQSKELVGRPAIYRGEVSDCCFTNTLVRFRATDAVLPEFALIVFLHYMKSGHFQKVAKITTNIAHLGAGRFAEMAFPVPTLEEQRAIVDAVKQQQGGYTHLAGELAGGSRQSLSLRRSVLKAAFQGDLVAQDRSDEPASILVERIAAERATVPATPKRRRSKMTTA